MRTVNPAGLAKIINEGFEGEVSFKADVQVHGNGTTLVSYFGEAVMKEDHSTKEVGRYILSSKFDQLKMMFQKSEGARITHPSEGATRIAIPLVFPQGYTIILDNLQDIKY